MGAPIVGDISRLSSRCATDPSRTMTCLSLHLASTWRAGDVSGFILPASEGLQGAVARCRGGSGSLNDCLFGSLARTCWFEVCRRGLRSCTRTSSNISIRSAKRSQVVNRALLCRRSSSRRSSWERSRASAYDRFFQDGVAKYSDNAGI